MDEQRRSFSIVLRPDNALDGLLALNASGQAADDPLMRELNMTAIADMTADGAMDIDELAYLVKRVGALNEVYDVDQFEVLMKQVEENYRGAFACGCGWMHWDWAVGFVRSGSANDGMTNRSKHFGRHFIQYQHSHARPAAGC